MKITVKEVYEDTYAIEQKSAFQQGLVYLVAGKERAALIDAGVKTNSGLLGVVRELTNLPVTLLLTHGHFDHIGSAAEFDEVYIHKDDLEVAAAHSDYAYLNGLLKGQINWFLRFFAKKYIDMVFTFEFPKNVKTFKDGETFDLGGRVLEVVHTPGHTPGSVCFAERASKTLFSGDTCCDWGILLNIEFCETPEVYLKSARRLFEMWRNGEFDVNFPGHHAFPCDAELPRKYLKCAEAVVEGSAVIHKDGRKFCAKFEDILIMLPDSYGIGR
ncbi:MAG: MBL fold metallo-hydrolase [Clostridiales bacterium]|jgi:glyoxylase-like metal-dependent hydrolase (beta-lactamase superfamily II)|nr:MBL fold metallo-hydrolase [Clostridiales bacterium]